jgi:polysaccharide biosynthesis transport protein
MDSSHPTGGLIRRPSQNSLQGGHTDLERIELKLDALRSALAFDASPRWSEADQDPDFQSSKLDQYWRAIRMKKGMVILTAFLGLLAAFLFSLTQTPVYRAKAALEIVGVNDNFMGAKDVDPMESQGYTTDSYIQTQADILASSSLVGQAVVAAGMTKPQPPRPEGKLAELLAAAGIKRSSAPPTAAQITRAAMGNVKVTPRRGTRLIDIEYDSTSAEEAATFANKLAAVFLDYSLASRSGASRGTAALLKSELDGLEQKVRQAEGEMEAYARSKSLMFTNTGTVAEAKLSHLQTELSKAQAERIAKQSSFEMASNSPAESLPEVLDNPALREYQSKLGELRRQLAQLRSIYTPEFYEVKRTEAQIAELESLATKERSTTLDRTRNEFQSAQRREKLLSDALAAQSQLVSQQSIDAVSYNLLKGQVDTYKGLYETMLQKVKAAQVASALRTNTARIAEPAETPSQPYKPRVPVNCAVGLLTGVLGGMLLVVLRDQSDRTIRAPGDLSLHTKLAELAVIPSVNADPYLKTLRDEPAAQRTLSLAGGQPQGLAARSPELAVWRYKPTLMAETFRGLLTSILFSSRDEDTPRVLVLTSAGPGEGKSTIISNLAAAMAEVQQRVLLIDADARKPRLHDIFGLPNDRGLTSFLTSRGSLAEADMEPAILETHIPGVSVLTSGPCHESISTLLHSSRLTEMLQNLKSSYDSILIDTPPVLQVPDARILGRRADTVILVARAGRTTRDAMLAARQRFHDDGVPVLGAILNDWTPAQDLGSGYYGGDYYQSKP